MASDAIVPGRVERRLAVDRAWERYVVGAVPPTGVPDLIAASWERAREEHIDPALTAPRRELVPDALEALRERDEGLRIAAPILREFAGALPGHVLAYLDPEGWLLELAGDGDTAERVASIHFRPGVNWSEASAGTNGPGTALATGRPVEVFASEHYVHAWHPWSCAAAPLLDPGPPDVRPVGPPFGLIDVTGPWETTSRRALALARAIARAVEVRWRAARVIRDEVVRYALQASRGGGEALVALDGRGGVLAVNDAAQRRGLSPAAGLPDPVREEVGRLLAASPAPDEVRVLVEGGAAVVTPVRFEGAPVGAIVRFAPARRAGHGPQPAARYHFGRILGGAAPLRRALELARVAARNDLPVVLSGESGTGKELFAHAIHAGGSRAAGPFVVVNCGAIPADLLEAELFGYEPGTFTGGRREGSAGRFEDADGGTVFLDEVSELPPAAQTALLRLLQEREVVRLGGSTPRHLDVRVVAATNRPLDEQVRAGSFRRDLYYRLDVLSIAVPPLRARGEDVDLLARTFLAEAEVEVHRTGLALSDDALAALRAWPWPGNVRELRNVILRAAATAPGETITGRDLQFDDGGGFDVAAAAADAAPAAGRGTLREAVVHSERARLVTALEACGWSCTRAARELGVSRMTVYRLMARYGVSRASGGATAR